MIKIAIVEDNQDIREMTSRCVSAAADDSVQMEIEEFASAEEMLTCLKRGAEYDILLADIMMPGMNGMQLGQIVRQKYPDIYLIFLTSYSDFAVKSYAIDAYQYILKDQMQTRLPEVIRKLTCKIIRERREYRWVGNNLDRRKLFYKDIICICKIKGSKYIEYMLMEDTCRERITMTQLLKELNDDRFILVDRSYAVNVNHIVRVKGNTIYLENNEKIMVSHAHIAKAKEKIARFWGRQE